MSKKEILEEAIQKAIDGGWDKFGFPHYIVDATGMFVVFDSYDESLKKQAPNIISIWKQYEAIIFNHDFAKALWGEDQLGINYSDLMPDDSDVFYEGCTEGLGYEMPVWRHHLQQMVIAEDPIAYLRENI